MSTSELNYAMQTMMMLKFKYDYNYAYNFRYQMTHTKIQNMLFQ